MKITTITVWRIDLPLSKPYWLSGGRLKFEVLDSTFVRVDTDANICGWGEGCPWGHTYLPAHGGGIRAALAIIAPALIGKEPRAIDEINQLMDTTLPGHLYAKSAVDIACWDILGKAADMPLWQLLGAQQAAAVAVNSSISTGTPAQMIADIQAARAAGYKTHSAKIGGDNITADIERINQIEAARNDNETITFDINRAWTPAVAVQTLNAVNFCGWVEQPCETLAQCAHVAAAVSQPIMLDECLDTFDSHLAAWQLNACCGIKLKPNRVGGLTRARHIRDFAVNAGWQMHIEDVGGSVVADTAAIHLAASTPAANRLASWLCHAHLTDDIAPGQGARNIGGFATPPAAAGLGVAPDINMLGAPCAVYQ